MKRKQLLAENIEGIMLQDQETVIVVVVIYRPSIYPSKYFLQNLQTLLDNVKQSSKRSIVMGDFNENLLASSTPIKNLMENSGFRQLVTFHTTENRTLIDHVYSTIPSTEIQVSLVPTYFSYHEAISIQITK